MFYIPKSLFQNEENTEKVWEILKDFEINVGENVQEKHDASLQAIKDLGEERVYAEILRQLGC